MIRCPVHPGQIRGGLVRLDVKQRRHLVTVLRLAVGDEFIVVDGCSAPQVAELETVRADGAVARLLRPAPLPPPEPWLVALAVAIPRHPGAFDMVVDQATQLGASSLIPMVTARSVVRLDQGRAAIRHRRWCRLAAVAAGQSGRATIPRIDPLATFPEVLDRAGEFDRILIPTVSAPFRALETCLPSSPAPRLLVLIGPEGDFSPEELAAAERAGASLISLGPAVLRCETAAISALALALYVLRLTPPGVLWHSCNGKQVKAPTARANPS